MESKDRGGNAIVIGDRVSYVGIMRHHHGPGWIVTATYDTQLTLEREGITITTPSRMVWVQQHG